MNTRCKVCLLGSDLSEQVNQKLLNGESYEAVAKWLKEEKEVKITPLSVMGHSKHLDGYQVAKKIDPVASTDESATPLHVDVNDQLDQLGIDPTMTNPFSPDGIRHISKRYLQQIILNQMAIVLEKQSKQMLGEASYPSTEIRNMIELIQLAGYLKPESKNDLYEAFGGLK
jgi:hypothetical protein